MGIEVEGHLAALSREGAIVMGNGRHLSIRVADADEAPVIEPIDGLRLCNIPEN